MSIETLEDRPGEIRLTEDQLTTIVAERVRESIDDVRASMRREDVGWQLVKGVDDADGGLELKDLKEWSQKLRSSVIAAPWIKRGLGLRHSYIWKGGIKYAGIPEDKQGRKSVQGLIDDTQNQREFFGARARREREGRLYHDGLALWIGKNSSKKLEAIPLSQIEADLRHPEMPGVIVGYLRKWKKYDFVSAQSKDLAAYYIVNGYESLFDGVTKIRPTDAGDPVGIDKTYTAFHQRSNTMDGFGFGAPDALAAWIWNQIGRDAYMDGVTMTKALASIAFKATSKTKSGAQKASIEFAAPRSAGSAAVLGGTNDMSALATAGKGYDYDSLRGLISTIATSLDVSVIHLTSDPGAAGSSYGSAATLDMPTLTAMQARQAEHREFDVEILNWMGATEATARFDQLDSGEAIYRALQAEVLPWLQGVVTPEKFQERVAHALGISPDELGAIDDGILLPNNEASWERSDIDPKDDPAGSSGSPTQGRSNDGNGDDPTNSNDIRRD